MSETYKDFSLHFDLYAKNISFLMDKNGKWRLSPAYDMGFAYNPNGGWTSQHQMSVNGKFDGISRYDLLEIAKRNNIKDAPEIIDRISTIASEWGNIARDCGVPDKMIEVISPQFQFMH